jgi:hypothetical protein
VELREVFELAPDSHLRIEAPFLGTNVC